jgi:hypothetical protein
MRVTALGIGFVVLCGIGAAPLLVQTGPLSAPRATFSATVIASAPRGGNIEASRSDATDPSSCKVEGRTQMMATRRARPLSVAGAQ